VFIIVKRKGKKVKVDVSEKNCPLYRCFMPDKSLPSEDNYYYCSFRDLRGCPDIKIKSNGKMVK
jgi:hypothetical protein